MELKKILHEMDFERLAGTDGEAKGREVIVAHLQKMGLQPRLESFTLKGFESGTASVMVDGKSWEATPYGLCDSISVEGELVFLENADVLMHNPGAYDDKIVLYYFSDGRLYELANFSKVKAFIGISAPNKNAYSYSHRQNRSMEETFPSVMIRYDFAEELLQYAGQTVQLKINQNREEKTAYNIIVDIPGKAVDKNLTLLVGHYDTVARSHGASDNGGGSVCLLSAAEYFSQNQPKRDLRIIWFSGEELGLLGSFAYAEEHKDEIIERLRLVINVDLAGDPIGRNMLFTIGSKELKGYASGILKEAGLLFSDKLSIYSSDCMPFTPYEIPSLNLARVGGKALYYIHTEDDLPEYCSEDGLQVVACATKTLLDRILNAEYFPISKEIDDSLREKIEKYLWQSTLNKPDLMWVEKYKK